MTCESRGQDVVQQRVVRPVDDGEVDITLRRLVREASGCTLRAARELERLRSACRLLRADLHLPWVRSALEAGYCDQSHLFRAFRRWVGISPGRFFSEGHHHMNDVFARRVRMTIDGCPVVGIGRPELRPTAPCSTSRINGISDMR